MNWAIPPSSAKANHLQILMSVDVSFCVLFVRGLFVFFCVDNWQKRNNIKLGLPRKCETEIDWCLVNEQEMASFLIWNGEQVIGVEHWSLTSWFLEQRARSTFLYSRWWFQTWFIFTPIWGRFPIWLISFKWVETTNQLYSLIWSINFTTSPTSTCFHDDLVKGFSFKSDLP